MKKSAYLINTARGAIIDEIALVKILKEKAIAGAALDVFVEEPLPKNHPITQLDNVVMTPHLGWPTDAGFEGFAENAVDQYPRLYGWQTYPRAQSRSPPASRRKSN